MIRYEKLLEKYGIKDLDYVDENGEFYRDFKDADENQKLGYKGQISYDEDGVQILYIEEQYITYEPYLEETPAFNSEHTKKLVGINVENTNFEVPLHIDENRDYYTLYRMYKADKQIFSKEQRIQGQLYEINRRITSLNNKKRQYEHILSSINSTLYNLMDDDLSPKTKKKVK